MHRWHRDREGLARVGGGEVVVALVMRGDRVGADGQPAGGAHSGLVLADWHLRADSLTIDSEVNRPSRGAMEGRGNDCGNQIGIARFDVRRHYQVSLACFLVDSKRRLLRKTWAEVPVAHVLGLDPIGASAQGNVIARGTTAGPVNEHRGAQALPAVGKEEFNFPGWSVAWELRGDREVELVCRL